MDLSEIIAEVRNFAGYGDPTVVTDAEITRYIRMGEEIINRDLRVREMVEIDEDAEVLAGKIATPDGWLDTDFLLVDDKPVQYLPRSEYFARSDKRKFFSTSGNVIYARDYENGTLVEHHYFAAVEPLTGAATVISAKHPRLYITAAMIPISMRTEEAERAVVWQAEFDSYVQRANEAYTQAKSVPGNRMRRRPTGFK